MSETEKLGIGIESNSLWHWECRVAILQCTPFFSQHSDAVKGSSQYVCMSVISCISVLSSQSFKIVLFFNCSHQFMQGLGEVSGTPLQHFCLENPMDRGAGQAAVHGVAKSWTRLSNFTFTLHFHALEKEMATHSSVLARENPRDGGAWWAAVYGVTQSPTRLKRLSSSSSSSPATLQLILIQMLQF